ncbi:AgmX/PglI C-terminal domain-containing protein [Persicimonas caeni]
MRTTQTLRLAQKFEFGSIKVDRPPRYAPHRRTSGYERITRRIYESHRSRFIDCYEYGLQQDPFLSGTATVRYMVDSIGIVRNVDTVDASLSSPIVARCIEQAVRDLTFPEPQNGTAPLITDATFELGTECPLNR